jgi:putative transposase
MANTYTQLRTQLVFAVKGRRAMIPKQHKDQVEKYITALVQKRGHKLLAIYCMPDHIHIFIGQHPADSISDLVEEIKTASSKFIKQQAWMTSNFAWQRGFGAFSYAKSQTDAVVKYILNQEIHHSKKTFKEEYILFLEKFEIDYDPKYLFEFYDDDDDVSTCNQ